MRRPLTWLLLITVAGWIASCTGRYKMSREVLERPSAWPTNRADIAATGAIAGPDFTGKLDQIWQGKVNDRPVGPIILAHGQLAISGSRKRLWFFDCTSGDRLGRFRLGGIPQGGLVLVDSLAYLSLAHPRNRLLCTDLAHHNIRWQARIKDAAFAPIIVGNRLMTSSGDGIVTALDPKSGKLIWKFQTDGRLLGPVSAGDERLYVGSDDGTLVALSQSDGKELYRVKLRSPIVNAAAVADYIYVAEADGQLSALHPADGSVAWKVTLPSSTWTAPTVSDRRVIIACRNGDVLAYDAPTGRELWRYAAVDVVKASPIVVGGYVVIGTMAGAVKTLSAESGTLIGQARLNGAVAFSPVSDGSRVYVATQSGRVYCLGDLHEPHSKENQ
jgi:outer membrane protein assembly factor BamB